MGGRSSTPAYEHLDNLAAIVDVNRLGQRGPTRHGQDLDAYARRFRAFGWHTVEIDGHDVDAVDRAYGEAESTTGQPDRDPRPHPQGPGRRVPSRTARACTASRCRTPTRRSPNSAAAATSGSTCREPPAARALHAVRHRTPRTARATTRATRSPPGTPSARRSPRSARARGDVVALDGEVGDSTRAEFFAKEHPDRFFECYIAEQQLVAAAVGDAGARLDTVRRRRSRPS